MSDGGPYRGMPPGAVPPGPNTPPPPGYSPYAPYAPYPARRTNGLAIGSFVAGILAFFTCPIVGVVAVILGYRARARIRDSGQDGAGLALAGIILGWIGVAISVALVFVYGALIAYVTNADQGTLAPRRPPIYGTTSTTERTGPFGTTGTAPRSTNPPSGEIAAADCRDVHVAFQQLTGEIGGYDRGILQDAARTMHATLPSTYADDIDTLFGDALTRTDRSSTGAPPAAVVQAHDELLALIERACP